MNHSATDVVDIATGRARASRHCWRAASIALVLVMFLAGLVSGLTAQEAHAAKKKKPDREAETKTALKDAAKRKNGLDGPARQHVASAASEVTRLRNAVSAGEAEIAAKRAAVDSLEKTTASLRDTIAGFNQNTDARQAEGVRKLRDATIDLLQEKTFELLASNTALQRAKTDLMSASREHADSTEYLATVTRFQQSIADYENALRLKPAASLTESLNRANVRNRFLRLKAQVEAADPKRVSLASLQKTSNTRARRADGDAPIRFAGSSGSAVDPLIQSFAVNTFASYGPFRDSDRKSGVQPSASLSVKEAIHDFESRLYGKKEVDSHLEFMSANVDGNALASVLTDIKPVIDELAYLKTLSFSASVQYRRALKAQLRNALGSQHQLLATGREYDFDLSKSVSRDQHDQARAVPLAILASGANATVYSLKFDFSSGNMSDGNAAEHNAIFKPEGKLQDDTHIQKVGLQNDAYFRGGFRSVATYRLAKVLGMERNVPRTEYARVGDDYGVLQAMADGESSNISVSAASQGLPGSQSVDVRSNELQRAISDKTSLAQLRREVARVEVFDILCGQLDRHPKNVYISGKAGGGVELQLIDNDQAFGLKPHPDEAAKLVNAQVLFPKQIDTALAARIRALNQDPGELVAATVGLLTSDERQALLDRLKQLASKIDDRSISVLSNDAPGWSAELPVANDDTLLGKMLKVNSHTIPAAPPGPN